MIISSLLDTDLYKFTMMQVVLHQFPGAEVEYRFKCRNVGVSGIGELATYANEIRDEIRSLCRGERMIAHYVKNRVDPKTKTLIFSDGLTVPRTVELYQQFKGRCQLAFGIGTDLTHDMGYEPPQIVIKMIRCNGQLVAKLSDTPAKNMCEDEKYLAYLRQVFEIA